MSSIHGKVHFAEQLLVAGVTAQVVKERVILDVVGETAVVLRVRAVEPLE